MISRGGVCGRVIVGGLALLLALAQAPSARADVVQRVLSDLTPYDLKGDRSLGALDALAELSKNAKGADEMQMLSFLHTIAAVDLWLAARVSGNGPLEASVAERFGVEVARLPTVLSHSLRPLSKSMYKDTVLDAVAAVQALSGQPTSAGAAGTRVALAMLVGARERFSDGLSVDGLATLAEDPCPRIDTCDEPFARFNKQGRKALSALQGLQQAWARIDQVRGRDPLVDAVAEHADAIHGRMVGAEIAPGIRMTRGSTCPTVSGCGQAGNADVLVLVDEGAVRFGFAPRVALAVDGSLEMRATGEPIWPATKKLPLPASYPAYLRHVSSVVRVLADLRKDSPDLSIAVGADAKTKAHVWARVMLSARVAGFEQPMLLGRLESGEIRLQAVKVVTAFAAPKLAPSELRVMMLRKGYAVKRRGPTVSIDRVTDADGSLSFDISRLVAQADPDHTRDAQLRFMPDVAASALLNTALAMAPAKDPLTVILP